MRISDFVTNVVNELTGGAQNAFGARGANAAPAGASVSSAPAFAPVVGSFDAVPAPATAVPGPESGFAVYSGSVVDRLPPAAKEKLRRLRAAADDLSVVARAGSDRLADAFAEMQTAESRIRALERLDGPALNEHALTAALAARDRAREEVVRLNAEHAERIERARPLRELVFSLERYVERMLPSIAEIEPAPTVAVPQLRKNESFHDAVNEARVKIEKLKVDLQAVIDAPQPSESAKRRARAEIDALAARGAPGVMALLESQTGSIEWPQRFELAGLAMAGHEAVAVVGRDGHKPDPLALVAWLHKDELLKRVEQEIDQRSDDNCAMDEVTRQKKISQTRSGILAAERIEESLIEAAQAAGLTILRRADADPRALLSLADHMPAPRASAI